MSDSVFIDARNIRVQFPVYSAQGRSLRSHLIQAVGGRIGAGNGSRILINALDDVSLSLRSGDRVALIGGNGAGKSTFLKVLAGILEPTAGELRAEGRVSALLDLGMGMDPEATGYENIVMRSVFLGASFKEANARIPEIEEFSELGEYLRFPLRTYSTGMGMRLSFAIATSIKPEVLVLDEMIATGDASFTEKAKSRVAAMIEQLKILVIATHSFQDARSMCNRGVVLNAGKIVFDGPIDDAIDLYEGGLALPPRHQRAVA